MNVHMKNCLTCILPNVDAYVEARHLLVDALYLGFHITQERVYGV